MISEALNGCPEVVPDRLTKNQKVGIQIFIIIFTSSNF